jgi:hypothetical protein
MLLFALTLRGSSVALALIASGSHGGNHASSYNGGDPRNGLAPQERTDGHSRFILQCIFFELIITEKSSDTFDLLIRRPEGLFIFITFFYCDSWY